MSKDFFDRGGAVILSQFSQSSGAGVPGRGVTLEGVVRDYMQGKPLNLDDVVPQKASESELHI